MWLRPGDRPELTAILPRRTALVRASGDPAFAAAAEATLREIAMRRDHGGEFQYTGYALRPVTTEQEKTA
ncbi:hypothetical protein GCM10009609_41260 [Pseudonocardia aurantiaca]|uniref:Uncharacterized protein n=1 Tax=Pseudonocardia aurantiaca TaxID=75290 RepID=A0ABW4FNE3_9PSEU